MKGERDKEKITWPMFPRLHVNDTEKGGPKAPPRNKMALYEQFSIPSQRFISPASAFTLPPHNSGALVPSSSSSQGVGHERSVFSPFYIPPPTSPHSTENIHSRSSAGMDLKAAMMEFERKSVNNASNKTSNFMGHFSASAECSSFRPLDFPSSKNSNVKKFGDEDDFRVPTFIQAPCSIKDQNSTVRERQTPFCTTTQKDNLSGDGISVEPRCLSGNGIAEKGNVSRVRSEPFSRASLGDDHRSPKKVGNCNEESEKTRGSLQPDDADINDDISETSSSVDSISGLDVSPDDVVGVIGQKYFWKARKAIANQQRAFAVQVFELHRLIKVQKLIAGSPHLLHEDYPYSSIPPKVPAKNPSSEYILKSQTQIIKKDDSRNPSQHTECPTENAVQKLLLPSLDGDANKGHTSQFTGYGPYSGIAQPAHQWLVPVMSPSEGLVYKPYTGPCPPTPGFMAPVYGGCGPLIIPPVARDFTAPAYGVPATPLLEGTKNRTLHQQPGIGVISTGEVNLNMHSRSSCNISNQKSEAFSSHVWKFQTSKDSELQGSTASSPCERVQGGAGNVAEGRDVLPLFPVAPAMEGSHRTVQAHSSDQQNRVIKVVPHNPRSATESAARIFLSIQEERQQYESQ
ncbi:ELF3-like protein 2 [Tasmannia lanceolata]|uniref:ELF3-like protein 2 n=1 Tax=Tasmannia lanceolata TaxID=3420 RepID=UPI004063FA8F